MKFIQLSTLAVAATLTACVSKPQPITPEEQGGQAATHLKRIYNFAPSKPMSLDDVITHILIRNKDVATKTFEKDIAEGERLLAQRDYLPQLTANLNRSERDRLNLTTSARLGQEPIEGVDTTPSYSSPLEVEDTSLRVSWEILNVVKNIYTVKQKTNNVYIAQLNRERAAQNIFKDIFSSFYFTALNQAEGDQLRELMVDLKGSVDQVCSNMASDGPVNNTLADTCLSALGSINSVNELLRKIGQSEINLHALMAVHPDTPIRLIQPTYSDPGKLTHSKSDLIDIAIANRPEVAVEMYKQRNARHERTKAYLDVLPSVEIGYSYHDTDNPFVINDEWEVEDLAITWNIIGKVINAPLRAKKEKLKERLAGSRMDALLITAVTQSEIAHESYSIDREKWVNSYQRSLISTKKTNKQRTEYQSGAMSRIAYLQSEIDRVLNSLQAKADYAKMMDSLAMVYLSIGVPITPNLDEAESPEQLKGMIRRQLADLSLVGNTSI